MSYWYVETANSSTRDQREFLAKANTPDDLCEMVIRECGDGCRLIFFHCLSGTAQDIIEDEYKSPCADERVVAVILGIRNVIIQEGYDIMKKKRVRSADVHESGLPISVPKILTTAEQASGPDDELIPCTFEDIRELINFCLKKGMQEYLQNVAAQKLKSKAPMN